MKPQITYGTNKCLYNKMQDGRAFTNYVSSSISNSENVRKAYTSDSSLTPNAQFRNILENSSYDRTLGSIGNDSNNISNNNNNNNNKTNDNFGKIETCESCSVNNIKDSL